MPYVICPAREEAACAQVVRLSFSVLARDYGLTRQNAPTYTAFIADDALFRPGAQPFCLYEEEVLVGFVQLVPKKDKAMELEKLAVLPGYRHKGYGKALLDHCKAQVLKQGGTHIDIGIMQDNVQLCVWYEAQGFVHTGVREFAHLPFTVGFMRWQA